MNLAHYYGNSGQTCTCIQGRSTFFRQSVISALQETFCCYGCVHVAYRPSCALTCISIKVIRQLGSYTKELSSWSASFLVQVAVILCWGSHANTHTHSVSVSLSLSLTHTHTDSLSSSPTHTHTGTHLPTHTHTLFIHDLLIKYFF